MIIGLVGYKGSGKTTVTEYLVKKYGFKEYALAEPLKQIAMVFGFTKQQVYGTQRDKMEINDNLGICAREFLQIFGTDICRIQFKEKFPKLKMGDSQIIWIKLMENFIKSQPTNCNIVISDVRFPDESESIKKNNNSVILQIVRDSLDSDEYSKHSSERELKNIVADFQIINNDSIDKLKNHIDYFIHELCIN